MGARQTTANSAGHVLHVWEQDGDVWACCAYDHGPMCRMCRRVTDETSGLLAQVFDGGMEVWTEPDGSLTFADPSN